MNNVNKILLKRVGLNKASNNWPIIAIFVNCPNNDCKKLGNIPAGMKETKILYIIPTINNGIVIL